MKIPFPVACFVSFAVAASVAEYQSQQDAAPSMPPARYENPPPPPPRAIGWQDSFAQAEQLARETHRPILIAFATDGCAPCEAVRRNIYEGPSKERMRTEFVRVWRFVTSSDSLARKYDVSRYPAVVIDNGHRWARFTPSSDPARFDQQLTEAVEAVQ